MIRCYSELILLPTFEERFEYLKLEGTVGEETFGYDRYLNQLLYRYNKLWLSTRDKVIIRDCGCDLGIEGREIYAKPIIHHMNPITIEQILNADPVIFDPEFLITTVLRTHNAIHYGNADQLIKEPIDRKPYDTCPWRK